MRMNLESTANYNTTYFYPTTNLTVNNSPYIVDWNASSNFSSHHNAPPIAEKHPAYVAGRLLYRWASPIISGINEVTSWFSYDSEGSSEQKSSTVVRQKTSSGHDSSTVAQSESPVVSTQTITRNSQPYLQETAMSSPPSAPAPNFDLEHLPEGIGLTLDESLPGPALATFAGESVIGPGDLNADGIPDVVVNSPVLKKIYVLFGGSHLTSGSRNLSDLAVSPQGLVINGTGPAGRLGRGDTLAVTNDINGDGIVDFAFTDSNSVYVIYGGSYLTTQGVIDLTKLKSPQGLKIVTSLGFSPRIITVSAAGDLNNDNIYDIAIGVSTDLPLIPRRPYTYIVFGNPELTRLNVSDLEDMSSPKRLRITSSEGIGFAIRGIGDVDGDGFDDVIMGNPAANRDNPLSFQGQAAILFGNSNLTSLNDNLFLENLMPSQRLIINSNGTLLPFGLGIGFGKAGDVNNDGLADFLLSITDGRETLLMFGNSQLKGPGQLILETLPVSQRLLITGGSISLDNTAKDSGIGDINNDGIDDIAIGYPGGYIGGGSRSTRVIVLFGNENLPQLEVVDNRFLSSSQGLVFDSDGQRTTTIDSFGNPTSIIFTTRAGRSISVVGDVNNDGKNDFIVGAPLASTYRGRAGKAIIIFGSDSFSQAPTVSPTTAGPTTASPVTENPTTTPTTQLPTTISPMTANPTTLSPLTDGPTVSPTEEPFISTAANSRSSDENNMGTLIIIAATALSLFGLGSLVFIVRQIHICYHNLNQQPPASPPTRARIFNHRRVQSSVQSMGNTGNNSQPDIEITNLASSP